ncbi:homocysteine S-methyltransferase [Streptosporangiaceae bacterium NEAU-GS5]|nr:homocysteine S-methyltransferase [Streptosporangiaceae bacterium NEAU-GS5]
MSSLILDGGLATHLETLGCDLADDLWSAKLLFQDPSAIRQAHRDYFEAGADVATTASYQASFPGFERRGLSASEAEALMLLSVTLAMEARDEAGHGLVAASIGPYGAYRADASEYTGDYGLGEDELFEWHLPRFQLLAGSDADLLAFETIPSYVEGRAIRRLLDEAPVRAWVSFSCRDGAHLNDGTPFEQAAALFPDHLVGVNCTAPHFIPDLVKRGAVVAYPNSGETWDPANYRWLGTPDAIEFGTAAVEWRALGATHVGGCCRTTPDHIRHIRQRLS